MDRVAPSVPTGMSGRAIRVLPHAVEWTHRFQELNQLRLSVVERGLAQTSWFSPPSDKNRRGPVRCFPDGIFVDGRISGVCIRQDIRIGTHAGEHVDDFKTLELPSVSPRHTCQNSVIIDLWAGLAWVQHYHEKATAGLFLPAKKGIAKAGRLGLFMGSVTTIPA